MDALEGLKQLEDKSIDLVLTDPPYNVQGQIFKFGKKEKRTKFKWDEGFKTNKDYIAWCYLWLEQIERITKDSILIWSKYSDASYFIEFLENKGWKHKAGIVWHKTNPMPQIRKKNYLMSYETLLWFVRDNKNYKFNFSTQKEMHNFFESSICMGKVRTKHPSQKPLGVTEWLIKNHSNQGDIVLDVFMGSGTTAIACKNLNRKFIGFEISEEYCKIAEERLKQNILTELNSEGKFFSSQP